MGKVTNLTQVTITFSDETQQHMVYVASHLPQNVTKDWLKVPKLNQVTITFSDETQQQMVHGASHLPQNVTKRFGLKYLTLLRSP